MKTEFLTIKVSDSEFKLLELGEVNRIYKKSEPGLTSQLFELDENGFIAPEHPKHYDVILVQNENGSRLLSYRYKGGDVRLNTVYGHESTKGVYLRFDLSEPMN